MHIGEYEFPDDCPVDCHFRDVPQGQVEAASKEEAETVAWDGKVLPLHVSFCHHCAKLCENAEIADITIEEE